MGISKDFPVSRLEQARILENELKAHATGSAGDEYAYVSIREAFLKDPILRELLPQFVKTCRQLSTFWPFIKDAAPTYAERRALISSAFTPLIDHLEGANKSPADESTTDQLTSFDEGGVHAVWQKALERRTSDPEGAITIARTLLETVAKRILEDTSTPYNDNDDLPKLYGKAANVLKLAPNQHSLEPIKAILGGAMNVVNGIGTLRNRLSDAHGRGGKHPVKPTPRHARLAVNMAGTLASFLVETHLERDSKPTT